MRKVIDYIPYELQKVKDYQQISIALESYFDDKNAEIDQLNKNRNILTANEETIKKYEELLNIIPSSDATLDERRYAIWIKMTTKIPYTEQWLRHWLTELLGNKGYALYFKYYDYSFLLIVFLRSKKNFSAIGGMLDAIVPAHINYLITYGDVIDTTPIEYYGCATVQANIYDISTTLTYNTWDNYTDATWQEVKDKGTWLGVLSTSS